MKLPICVQVRPRDCLPSGRQRVGQSLFLQAVSDWKMLLHLLCMATLAGCAMGPGPTTRTPTRTPTLATPPIVDVEHWGGSPSTTAQPQHRISRITLHHQGEIVATDVDASAYLRRLQQWSRLTRRWSDIPYHYVIAPDGVIYSARPLSEPGDTNTDYNPHGHALVMLMGNFEVQQPSPAQLTRMVELMAWIAQSQGLSAAEIATHKDFSQQTVCPGKNLEPYLRSGWLHRAVTARMKGQALPAW